MTENDNPTTPTGEPLTPQMVVRWPGQRPTHPTVLQALAQARAAVGAVRKDSFNAHGKFNFRGIDAIVNATAGPLVDNGINIVPAKVVRAEHGQITYGSSKTVSQFTRLTIRYKVYGPAGDHITVEAVGEAFDSGDKATPKASSVAHRTALLQLLHIPTDDPDPDSHTYPPADVQPEPTPLDVAKARAWKATEGYGNTTEGRLQLLSEKLAKLDPPAEIPTAGVDEWTAVAVDLELNGFDVPRHATDPAHPSESTDHF